MLFKSSGMTIDTSTVDAVLAKLMARPPHDWTKHGNKCLDYSISDVAKTYRLNPELKATDEKADRINSSKAREQQALARERALEDSIAQLERGIELRVVGDKYRDFPGVVDEALDIVKFRRQKQ
jgi:hypothetical protein